MIVNYFFLLIILLISIVSPLSGNSISGSILASKYSSSINDFQKSADFNLKILEHLEHKSCSCPSKMMRDRIYLFLQIY